jgi:diacylglycerol kinase
MFFHGNSAICFTVSNETIITLVHKAKNLGSHACLWQIMHQMIWFTFIFTSWLSFILKKTLVGELWL